MSHSFPEGYKQYDCYLVPIDKAFLPHIVGLLPSLLNRRYWDTDSDYERGYNATGELLEAMALLCVKDLVESNNRLYRLLDATFNGTHYEEYTSSMTGETSIVPAIPPAPAYNGTPMLAIMLQQYQMLHNALRGAIYANFDDESNVVQLLLQIAAQQEAETTTDSDQLAQLAQIAALLA